MKTVGEVLIEPYEVDDFITTLFNNNYIVELSRVKPKSSEEKIQVVIKEK
jgi:hypothetical protein